MTTKHLISNLTDILNLSEEEMARFVPDLILWHKNMIADLATVGLTPGCCNHKIEWSDDNNSKYIGTRLEISPQQEDVKALESPEEEASHILVEVCGDALKVDGCLMEVHDSGALVILSGCKDVAAVFAPGEWVCARHPYTSVTPKK